jgi:hypothetical protein
VPCQYEWGWRQAGTHCRTRRRSAERATWSPSLCCGPNSESGSHRPSLALPDHRHSGCEADLSATGNEQIDDRWRLGFDSNLVGETTSEYFTQFRFIAQLRAVMAANLLQRLRFQNAFQNV